MSFSSLPTELVEETVACTVRDVSEDGRSARAHYPLTRSLCLVNHLLNAITTKHLYRHVVVPDADAGELLDWTLGTDRWTDGELAGKAADWVQTAEFGKQCEGGVRRKWPGDLRSGRWSGWGRSAGRT